MASRPWTRASSPGAITTASSSNRLDTSCAAPATHARLLRRISSQISRCSSVMPDPSSSVTSARCDEAVKVARAAAALPKRLFRVYGSAMREILPGILTWPWFSARHGYDFNGWLVRDPGGNVCIDPVEMDDRTLDEIAREGVARILLTNRNHFRASMRVRDRTNARVAVH